MEIKNTSLREKDLNGKKSTKLIWILVGVFILIVGAILLISHFYNKDRNIEFVFGDCNGLKDSLTREICFDETYYYNAVSSKDINICKKIKDFYLENECILNISISLGDSNSCEFIEYSDTSLKEECYLEISLEDKDASLCEKISDGELKKHCLAKITSFSASDNLDVETCERIEILAHKHDCIYRISKEEGCDVFSDVDLCENFMIFMKSYETMKFERCEELTLDPYKSVCFVFRENPYNYWLVDSDGDGMTDYKEVYYGYDPFIDSSVY